MWNSGITQGLMWRTYTEAGTLRYSFIESVLAMEPYYVARSLGGAAFLSGTLLAIFNIAMTIRQAPEARLSRDRPTSPEGEADERSVPAE